MFTSKKGSNGDVLQPGLHIVMILSIANAVNKINPNWTDLAKQVEITYKNALGKIKEFVNTIGYKRYADLTVYDLSDKRRDEVLKQTNPAKRDAMLLAALKAEFTEVLIPGSKKENDAYAIRIDGKTRVTDAVYNEDGSVDYANSGPNTQACAEIIGKLGCATGIPEDEDFDFADLVDRELGIVVYDTGMKTDQGNAILRVKKNYYTVEEATEKLEAMA